MNSDIQSALDALRFDPESLTAQQMKLLSPPCMDVSAAGRRR